MNQEEITNLARSKNGIDEEGRLFLTDRYLSIAECQKAGICSRNGLIYFPYMRDGEIVRYKTRSMEDKKIQRTSEVLSGDPETFKMPFFCQFKCPTSADLFITEGEFDCIALRAVGARNCVSLPYGSGSVESTFRNNYEFLQEFDRIFICFDMDAAGQEAAKKAMSMISPAKYRRLNFPHGCKDANDWIKSEQFLDEPELQKLMDSAVKIQNPSVTPMYDLSEDYYCAIDKGISSGWSKLDMILGGVRTGEVTVISAETGSGKSTFCINFMKNLADQGQGIWLNSYEMSPLVTNRKFASAVLRKPMKWNAFSEDDVNRYHDYLRDKKCYLNTTNANTDLAALRKLFELVTYAYGVKYILLDHLDYIQGAGKKTTLENIDEAMRGIHMLALEFKVGVILVAHPKQMEVNKEVTSNDLKGSSAIKQYADNIIVITRMDRIVNDAKDRVKVRVWKNRLAGIESFFYLQYNPETDGYTQVDLFENS